MPTTRYAGQLITISYTPKWGVRARNRITRSAVLRDGDSELSRSPPSLAFRLYVSGQGYLTSFVRTLTLQARHGNQKAATKKGALRSEPIQRSFCLVFVSTDPSSIPNRTQEGPPFLMRHGERADDHYIEHGEPLVILDEGKTVKAAR